MDRTRSIKWLRCNRKILINFYYFGAAYMLAIYVACPFRVHFLCCMPFQSLFLHSHVIPFLLKAKPPTNHNFSSEWHTKCCFWVVPNVFWAANHPYPEPPPQLHTVHPSCTQPWSFSYSKIVYLCSPNTVTYIIFSQDSYPPLFSEMIHLNPHQVCLVLTQ